jgi:hypothetical protein
MANEIIPFRRKYLSGQKPPLGTRLNIGNAIANGLMVGFLWNEHSGLSCFDASIGQIGTLNGSVTWSQNGVEVSGTSDPDSRIQIPDSDFITDIGARTYVLFGNVTSDHGTTNRVINKGAGDGFVFDSASARDKRLKFEHSTTGTSVSRETVDDAVIFNESHQYVMAWDGSLTASNIKIYRDANEVSYAVTTNGTGTLNSDSGTDLFIFNRDSLGRAPDGIFQYLYIYNRVLAESEIKSLYADPYQMFEHDILWLGAAEAVTGNPWNYYAQQ